MEIKSEPDSEFGGFFSFGGGGENESSPYNIDMYGAPSFGDQALFDNFWVSMDGAQSNFSEIENTLDTISLNETEESEYSQPAPHPVLPITTYNHPVPPRGELGLVVEEQPPVEVRTRTQTEKRTFSCALRVVGDWENMGARAVSVELRYSGEGGELVDAGGILGGPLVVAVGPGGIARFDGLTMRDSSAKHGGREFALAFNLLRPPPAPPIPLASVSSQPFYAFSNQKVLTRRKKVELRALSSTIGPCAGGTGMHVIGQPFINTPSLRVVLQTPHGAVQAAPVEWYSETVLFFTLPPYPAPAGQALPEGVELRCHLQVSNDGRTFSNPVDFTYVAAGNPASKKMRSRF